MEEPWDLELVSRLADGVLSFLSAFAEDWAANDMRVALFKILLGWLVLSLVAIHFAWKVYGSTVNDMYYRLGEAAHAAWGPTGGLARRRGCAAGRGAQAARGFEQKRNTTAWKGYWGSEWRHSGHSPTPQRLGEYDWRWLQDPPRMTSKIPPRSSQRDCIVPPFRPASHEGFLHAVPGL
ncbi:T-cell leukemia translocation-altered protein-like [Scleropages formosus]|uniref:T-cell leukemia translocation-altered protein-like n=1 Tax=Scleropages formosus TaxID=113540 RepID=A0A0N8K2L1_SCLFO|nr:T-cell leukemia translocation-altered protein-like [Scleropages formosus]